MPLSVAITPFSVFSARALPINPEKNQSIKKNEARLRSNRTAGSSPIIMSVHKSTEKQPQRPQGENRLGRRRSQGSPFDESPAAANSSGVDSASRRDFTRHGQTQAPSRRVLNEDSPDLELEIPTGVPLRELGFASSRRWNISAVRRREETHPSLDFDDFYADSGSRATSNLDWSKKLG